MWTNRLIITTCFIVPPGSIRLRFVVYLFYLIVLCWRVLPVMYQHCSKLNTNHVSQFTFAALSNTFAVICRTCTYHAIITLHINFSFNVSAIWIHFYIFAVIKVFERLRYTLHNNISYIVRIERTNVVFVTSGCQWNEGCGDKGSSAGWRQRQGAFRERSERRR